MADSMQSRMETLRFWTVFLGVLQVTVGCLVGLIPPDAVSWFRGIVMAHIEFTANGVLMIALGLLAREMRLSDGVWSIWFVLLQIGTWCNGAAGVAGALSGATASLLPTLNEKFPPPHGTDNPVVAVLLMVCAVSVLAALSITLAGLLRGRNT